MEDEKRCGRCGEIKPFVEFNFCKGGTFGRHNHCRSCQKEVKRLWYLKHAESEREKALEYALTPKAKAARKKYWQKNKESLKIKNNNRRKTEQARALARKQRERWLSIPENKIACNLRARIRSALLLSVKLSKKSKSCEKLLGCQFEELKTYLESKFTDGMNWDNYGEWHIDHIIPCKSFDLSTEDNQKKCFNYRNLQPLWAKDNLSKGSSILP